MINSMRVDTLLATNAQPPHPRTALCIASRVALCPCWATVLLAGGAPMCACATLPAIGGDCSGCGPLHDFCLSVNQRYFRTSTPAEDYFPCCVSDPLHA
jgi:hypothetical protein